MKTTRIVLILALFALALLPALAQKETPPAGGTPKDFKLPEKKTFTLPNGLGVTMVQYGTIPKVTVSLNILTGNINEEANEVWLADLMGDLMKEGTTTRTAKQVSEEAALMGGSVDIGISEDQTTIGGDVLMESGPALVALIADVVRNPRFPETELARLKNDRLRQLSISKTNPGAMTLEKFRAVLYGDHPYGRLFPTEEMLSSYTLEQVKEFYKENFGAKRSHLYVVGKFTEKEMEAAVRSAFGDWNKGSDPVRNVPKPASKREIHIIDRPGAAQSTVYIGLPVIDATHPDYVPLQVTNLLLGGSFASRITRNIRENKGYTYSPSSQLSVRYRDGYWAEVADVTTDVTGASLKEIIHEIDSLATVPPSKEELEGIQNYRAGTFVLNNSSRGGIIGQLSFLRLHGLPEKFLTDYVKNIYAVTPEQVREMTKKYIRPADMSIVIAGDKAKITGQVVAFGSIVQ